MAASCAVLLTGLLASSLSAQLGSAKDPAAAYRQPLIKSPVDLSNVKEFRDAALLHLNNAIATKGVAVAKGAGESCAVDKSVDFRVVTVKTICTKNTRMAELKPLSLEQAIVLRQVVLNQTAEIAAKETGLKVDELGIEGTLQFDQPVSAKDAVASYRAELAGRQLALDGLVTP